MTAEANVKITKHTVRLAHTCMRMGWESAHVKNTTTSLPWASSVREISLSVRPWRCFPVSELAPLVDSGGAGYIECALNLCIIAPATRL